MPSLDLSGIFGSALVCLVSLDRGQLQCVCLVSFTYFGLSGIFGSWAASLCVCLVSLDLVSWDRGQLRGLSWYLGTLPLCHWGHVAGMSTGLVLALRHCRRVMATPEFAVLVVLACRQLIASLIAC